jgi:uncharacterized protein YjgD (DUF1641 family)
VARPILLELPPRDPRSELQARLAASPAEHAEALLAAYEVLQGLHDRGVFDLARGALGSSDRILEILVEEVKSPESIQAMRNFIVLTKLFGSIDTERLRAITGVIDATLLRSQPAEPPSLWAMFKKLWNRDFRRGLAIGQDFLEKIGRALSTKEPPSEKD